jgi:hypothetical protein
VKYQKEQATPNGLLGTNAHNDCRLPVIRAERTVVKQTATGLKSALNWTSIRAGAYSPIRSCTVIFVDSPIVVVWPVIFGIRVVTRRLVELVLGDIDLEAAKAFIVD